MRILVLSDIHGDLRSAMQAVNAQPSADMLVFCGDGTEQFKYLKNVLPDKTVVGVRGNCDFGSDLQPTEIVTAGGKTLFITHGHLYQAKFSIYNMVCAAREANADVLLFGHTHNAFQEYDDGLYIMNPGHCGGYGASYGIVDITDKGDIVTNIVRLSPP